MVKVSIISLIYCSKKYADGIFQSVQRFTPMISRGEAEFFFIANDPTDEIVKHLTEKGYPFFLNKNERKTNEELFSRGYGTPEYIHRVYRGFNLGILKSKGEIVVLLNSDNCVSPDWLENLLKYLGPNTIVTSHLVERSHPAYGVFPGAYHCEFGHHPDNFDEERFLDFVLRYKMTGIIDGGAYMPCAFYKKNAVTVGLYPEGNIAGKTFDDVIEYGDENFFRKLADNGIVHVTSLDSIVYHFKEGEMDDTNEGQLNLAIPKKNIKQPHHFPLKSIMIATVNSSEFLTFDKNFILFTCIKSITTKAKKKFIRMKNRIGLIKNKILQKKSGQLKR